MIATATFAMQVLLWLAIYISVLGIIRGWIAGETTRPADERRTRHQEASFLPVSAEQARSQPACVLPVLVDWCRPVPPSFGRRDILPEERMSVFRRTSIEQVVRGLGSIPTPRPVIDHRPLPPPLGMLVENHIRGARKRRIVVVPFVEPSEPAPWDVMLRRAKRPLPAQEVVAPPRKRRALRREVLPPRPAVPPKRPIMALLRAHILSEATAVKGRKRGWTEESEVDGGTKRRRI